MERSDARGLEREVHDGLKEMDGLFIPACVREKARQAVENNVEKVVCSHCGDWARLLDRERKRRVVTIRRHVDYRRSVYQCTWRECRGERAPFDEELGLEAKGHFSPLVHKKAAWAGAMLTSFDKASEDMKQQAEIPVSSKQMQRITERVAERALELQDQEIAHLGRPVAWDHVVEAEEKPETVVLEMDGTCVMGRDGEGHDVKCATVFGLDARAKTGSPGKERPLLLRRAYCAASRGIQSFRAMVWALCVWWGIRSARRVVIRGDGIDWISRNDASRDELRLRAEYFRTHAERMRYPEYRAMGLPIGSGVIEGTCKNLVKGRMSCVGQHWGEEEGIERMTALRVRIFNQRYEDLWKTQAERLAA